VNTSRFPYNGKPGVASLPWAWEFPQWIRATPLSCAVLRDFAVSGQKRIFAIVSRPIAADVKGRTIRRVLVFDNHPDSLRLVFESGKDLDSDDAASRRTSIICGSILIAIVVGTILWSLLW
jgi:hypothetical protein